MNIRVLLTKVKVMFTFHCSDFKVESEFQTQFKIRSQATVSVSIAKLQFQTKVKLLNKITKIRLLFKSMFQYQSCVRVSS